MLLPPRLRPLHRIGLIARRLTREEWRDVGRAQRAVLTAHIRVALAPRGRLATLIASDASAAHRAMAAGMREQARARALARAVHRASRYGMTRPYCLVRAIALLRLLHAEDIPGVLRVGVRRDAGALLAHAWVELDGVTLGESASEAARYVALPGMALLEPGG